VVDWLVSCVVVVVILLLLMSLAGCDRGPGPAVCVRPGDAVCVVTCYRRTEVSDDFLDDVLGFVDELNDLAETPERNDAGVTTVIDVTATTLPHGAPVAPSPPPPSPTPAAPPASTAPAGPQAANDWNTAPEGDVAPALLALLEVQVELLRVRTGSASALNERDVTMLHELEAPARAWLASRRRVS
jgi:hypothetical protein